MTSKTDTPVTPATDATEEVMPPETLLGALTPLESFTGKQADDSSFADVDAFVRTFNEHLMDVAEYRTADEALENLVAVIARNEVRMRLGVVNKYGAPDLAGNTHTWKNVVTDRLQAAYRDLGVDVDKMQNRTAVYRSRNNVTAEVAAEYALAHSPTLGGTPIKVNGQPTTIREAFENRKTGDVIPSQLRTAVKRELYSKQKSAKGVLLPGFDAVPELWGPKPKSGNGGGGGNGDTGGGGGGTTAVTHADKLAAALPQTASDAAAGIVWQTVSAFSTAFVGEKGKAAVGKVTRRADTVTSLRKAVQELTLIVDFLDPNDNPKPPKDTVLAARQEK